MWKLGAYFGWLLVFAGNKIAVIENVGATEVRILLLVSDSQFVHLFSYKLNAYGVRTLSLFAGSI